MMENLDKKFDNFADKDYNNTYLIEKKKSKFSRIINLIKNILLKREFKSNIDNKN